MPIDGQDALRFCLAMPIDRRTRWALRGICLLRQSIESSDLRRCTLSCAHSALPHNPLRRTAVDLPKDNFRLSLSTAVARSLACPTDRTTGALCRATSICAMTTYGLGFRTAWNLPAVDPRDSLALRLGCGRERRCAEWIQTASRQSTVTAGERNSGRRVAAWTDGPTVPKWDYVIHTGERTVLQHIHSTRHRATHVRRAATHMRCEVSHKLSIATHTDYAAFALVSSLR